MITKATIEEKIDKYRFRVRVPIYNKQKGVVFSTPTEELDIALVCTLPGCNVNYQVGDVVYVGFDNSQEYEPVILGLLYREKDTGTLMSITAESVRTKVSTELSSHTKIGSVSEDNIKALIGANTSLQIELDKLRAKTTPTAYTTAYTHESGVDDVVTVVENVDEYTATHVSRISTKVVGEYGIVLDGCRTYIEKDTDTYNIKVRVPAQISETAGTTSITLYTRIYKD